MATTEGAEGHRGTISPADATNWVTTATAHVNSLLRLPGVPAAPKPVRTAAAPSAHAGLYGSFMLTWPEVYEDRSVINHLPSGDFFLHVLAQAYEPILRQRPDLRTLLSDRTRLELALTNDVLQVQLIEGPGAYSMIRHHSLMLFEATLWLPRLPRRQWLDLYTLAAKLAHSDRTRTPSKGELSEIEGSAFEVMRQKAEQSADPEGMHELTLDPAISSFLEYQMWATAALGALTRDYVSHEGERSVWHARNLADYPNPEFLLDRLTF